MSFQFENTDILIAKTMFFKLDYVLMMDQTHSQNQGYLNSQILTVTSTLEVWEETRILKWMIMKNLMSHKSWPWNQAHQSHWLTLNGTAWSCDGLEILSFYLKVFLECSCGRLASFLSSFFNNGFVFKCNTSTDKVNPF